MCALHRQDRLPAVVFNFDRTVCESIAFGFNSILSRAEEAARSEHAKTLAKSAKAEVQKEKVQKRIRDKVLSEKKEEAMLQEIAEMAEANTVEAVGLDELTFKAQFTFVQEGRSSQQDFDRVTESARKIMGEGHPLIQILRRGIGVHHSGLQNKYRMAGKPVTN
jgi:superfamily II RNA helicase